MSDEQKMPEVMTRKWYPTLATRMAGDSSVAAMVDCEQRYNQEAYVTYADHLATIATLTAERDAERASAMAFHVELQRLRMWCGEFVSRIEQRGVVGISDDADLVDIFREAALAQLKEQADD